MDIGSDPPASNRLDRLAVLGVLRAGAEQVEVTVAPVRAEATTVDGPAPWAAGARLRGALAEGQLRVFFQPVVTLADGVVVGFEALLRWDHPDRGLLLPDEFLPAGDPSALPGRREVMAVLAGPVLAGALAVLGELRRGPRFPGGLNPGELAVTVNLSAAQLSGPGLAGLVLELLAQHRLPGSALTLEVTEAVALTAFTVAAAELGRLRAAGVGVCLGDYGTGWSGLARLLELPFDSLKLDRTLTGYLGSDPRIGAVVTSTAALAADLGLRLVVEGVETEEQRRILLAAGYTRGQGWLFGAAVPAEQLPALLAALPPGHRRRWHPSQGPR